MRCLAPIPAPTDLGFLEGQGFTEFEVLETAIVYSVGQTSLTATLMFDEPTNDWATLVFPIEATSKWRCRVGRAELGKFAAALGVAESLTDSDQLVGKRAALRVADNDSEFARLAA